MRVEIDGNTPMSAAELMAKGGQTNMLEGRRLTLKENTQMTDTYEPGDDGRLSLVHQPPCEWMRPPGSTLEVPVPLHEPNVPDPPPIPTLPRPCWFQPRTWEQTHWVIGEWESGTLHAWGTDFEEFEAGPALFPIGVVADERGAVHSVCVDRIRLELA